jgi:Transposase DDE domain
MAFARRPPDAAHEEDDGERGREWGLSGQPLDAKLVSDGAIEVGALRLGGDQSLNDGWGDGEVAIDRAGADTVQEPVDVVVFHDPAFKEPWFLLVPAGSQEQLPTDAVVDLYRERMHIELTFRDWKTHLGVRGLRLEVDAPSRLGRLLLALSLAYILAVLLGAGPLAARVRAHAEVLRSTPRHGTRRRLSALSIGILALSLGRCVTLARDELHRLLAAFQRGVPAAEIPR